MVNIVSLTASNYYAWEEWADHGVYGSLVCLQECFPEQLINSLESGSASPGALRSKGIIWNGRMVGIKILDLGYLLHEMDNRYVYAFYLCLNIPLANFQCISEPWKPALLFPGKLGVRFLPSRSWFLRKI